MLGRLNRAAPERQSPSGSEPDGAATRRRALVLCSLALPLLLWFYVLALWTRTRGTELRIDQFTNLARQVQIANATILIADDRIVGAYAEGRYTVAVGSDTLFSRLLDVLDEASVPTNVDQQSFKSLLMPITYVLPAFIMIDGILIVLLIFGKYGDAMLGFGRSAARWWAPRSTRPPSPT